MADPSQNVGSPPQVALNPGTPADQAWLAETPTTLIDNYDVVMGNGTTTVGLMLYRAEEGAAPDKTYKTEPVDYEYAGTFVSRANVGSGFGDDQQDFWMTFTQKDWSGGMGHKYFSPNDPNRARSYWDCYSLNTTKVPGQAAIGGLYHNTSGFSPAANSTDQAMLYYVNTVRSLKGYNCIVAVTSGATNSTVTVNYSVDGGITWTLQPTSSATKWHDITDAIVGDNGLMYFLESVNSTTNTLSTIHILDGPGTASTIAWDNSTNISGSNWLNCIAYWTGGPSRIYGGTAKGQLISVTTGSTASGIVMKDFGGGTIIDILATVKGIYCLYFSTAGEYKIFLYDGVNTTEVARLPRGWRYHPVVEQQLDAGLQTAAYSSQNVMDYLDGVLYVAGLTPARDVAQSDSGYRPLRQALWFYGSGNSGVIWESDYIQQSYLTVGGSGCLLVANGLVLFEDLISQKMMAYDPSSQGVTCYSDLVGNGTNKSQYTAQSTNNGTVSATLAAGQASINQVSFLPTRAMAIGQIVHNNSRTADDLLVVGVGSTTLTRIVMRGYGGTTYNVQWNQTDNCIVPVGGTVMQPHHSLVFDIDKQYLYTCNGFGTYMYTNNSVQGETSSWLCGSGGISFVEMQPNLGWPQGYLATSLYDFDSSMPKYFRDVQWDGVLSQGVVSPLTDTAGTVDLYYKLDDVPNSPILTGTFATTQSISASVKDSSLVLIQAAAQPGTRYTINATGKAISVVAFLNSGTTNVAYPAVQHGPLIRRISVRAAPITPSYRQRTYQFALFENMTLKNGVSLEPRTPSQLRKDLETMISTNTPLTVYDSGVSGMTAMFDLNSTKIREMRPNEYIAYVTVREI